MTTKYDKILIIAVIVFSIGSIFFSKKFVNDSGSKTVYIEVNGEKYKEILMDPSMDEEIEIKTEYGRNVLKIEDETVRVIEASCPDKLDVKQGRISKPGEVIVCLPNKLLIEIKGKKSDDENEVDFISR